MCIHVVGYLPLLRPPRLVLFGFPTYIGYLRLYSDSFQSIDANVNTLNHRDRDWAGKWDSVAPWLGGPETDKETKTETETDPEPEPETETETETETDLRRRVRVWRKGTRCCGTST